MPPSAEGTPNGPRTWEGAPCGLLRIDSRGLVLAVNDRFLEETGYTRTALIGRRNWNDLMSAGARLFYQTQLAPVLELDGGLEEVMLDLRRADGERLPALVNLVRTADDGPAGVLIAVMKVADRRAYEQQLRTARDDAVRSAAADRHSRRRLEVLARANAALASSVDIEIALARLARVLVDHLGDWCLICLTDDTAAEVSRRWSAAHTDPSKQDAARRLGELLPSHLLPASALSQVFAGAPGVLLTEVSAEHQQESTDSAEARELFGQLGLASALVVPSTGRGTQVATIVLARGPQRSQFTEDDLTDLSDLGARAGIVIDNLRQRAREHDNSVALQQALLTTPPQTPALQIVTRYLPATTGNNVGGDWYDAFVEPDGTPVLVIGDVAGHDIRAAAAMGQLRGLIRTIGYTRPGAPAATLATVDATARGLSVDVLATALVARIHPEPTGGATVEWSNAGHPPPLVVTPSGAAQLLQARPDRLLGLPDAAQRHNHSFRLSAGDTLLLYTDGLVERPDEDIEVGLARLTDVLTVAAAEPLEQLCERVLNSNEDGRRDDIALLAIRIPSPEARQSAPGADGSDHGVNATAPRSPGS